MTQNDNVTEGFVQTHGLGICRGHYAPALVKEWHKWDASHESENDAVDRFPEDQLYVVFVFADGGVDLEHFELRGYQEAQSILLQASNQSCNQQGVSACIMYLGDTSQQHLSNPSIRVLSPRHRPCVCCCSQSPLHAPPVYMRCKYVVFTAPQTTCAMLV